MRFLLFVGRHVTSFLLSASLFVLIFTIGFSSVVFNEQTIKESLAESSLYDEFIVATIDKVQTEPSETFEMSDLPDVNVVENGNQPVDDKEFLPLNDDELKQIVNDSIPPATVQKHVETLITSLFRWLDKTDENIEFTINMTDTKNLFITNLSNFAAQKVTKLPECNLKDLGSIDTDNVFDLTCRPPGFSAMQASDVVVNELSNGEFLQDPIVTEDFLSENDDGSSEKESFQENISFLPSVFNGIKTAKSIALIMLVLSSVTYILIRKPIRNGIRKLGWRFLASGLVSLLLSIIFKFLLPNMLQSNEGPSEKLAMLANDALVIHLGRLANYLIVVSLIIAFTGLLILLSEKIERKYHLLKKINKH